MTEKEVKKKIKLVYPIEMLQEDGSKKVYEEIEIGRLKNKHLKNLPKDFMKSGGKITLDQLVPIISAIANLPAEVVDEMDIEDTTVVSEALESFFSQSQKTGSA